MKVGAWSKLPSLSAAAIREARARVGKPGAAKERKRTAMIGLPDLPVAPELEQTTPLIYAVRALSGRASISVPVVAHTRQGG